MSLLETLHDLSPEQSELLFSTTLDEQLITVRQYQNLRWLSAGGDMIQSLMDVDKPEQLLLPNLAAMLAVLHFAEHPQRLLNLGAGAGSFERSLRASHPELAIISVEPNRTITELGRRYFNMDNQQQVIEKSAEQFLAGNEEQYDVILCDMFSAEKQPACLYDERFYQNMARAMNPGCVLASNLLPESEDDLIQMLLPLKAHFGWLLLHEVPNHANVVVYALSDRPADAGTLQELLSYIKQDDNIELQIIAQNLERLSPGSL